MRWFLTDVLGLFSIIVVSFSINLVLSDQIFSNNVVPKPRMFSVPAIYVLGPLQLISMLLTFWTFFELQIIRVCVG